MYTYTYTRTHTYRSQTNAQHRHRGSSRQRHSRPQGRPGALRADLGELRCRFCASPRGSVPAELPGARPARDAPNTVRDSLPAGCAPGKVDRIGRGLERSDLYRGRFRAPVPPGCPGTAKSSRPVNEGYVPPSHPIPDARGSSSKGAEPERRIRKGGGKNRERPSEHPHP